MSVQSSWAVQATVDEPVELICAFVAHHLELGAAAVLLYLDQPQPALHALLAGHPKVRLTDCDANWWAAARPEGRPLLVTDRQIFNTAHAMAGLQQDWLLVCDADEFLAPPSDLGTLLARQPPETAFLRVAVAERVVPDGLTPATIFDGAFRLRTKGAPLSDAERNQMYGPEIGPMLQGGLAGHFGGKSLVRKGAPLTMGIHFPEPPSPREGFARTPPWQNWLAGGHIAHFDALTPLHCMIKLLAKDMLDQLVLQQGAVPERRSPARNAQVAFAVAACRTEKPLQQVARLHKIGPRVQATLRARGEVIDLPLAPARAALLAFPDANLDYTTPGFSRALRQKHAALLARYGLNR